LEGEIIHKAGIIFHWEFRDREKIKKNPAGITRMDNEL